MSDFANLRDGGRQLGLALLDALSNVPDPVLLACMPNGVPVALGVRETLDIAVLPLPVERSDSGVTVAPMPELAGRNVVVVDDAVESGTVARAAALALMGSGVGTLILAVPVCAPEAQVDLEPMYDQIVAVVHPVVRRSLEWHYEHFDTIDEVEARRLLEKHPA